MNTAKLPGIIGWILAAAIMIFMLFLLYVFISNLLKADANVIASIIGLFGIVTAALVTNYKTKEREISARLFNNKREGYTELINLIFDLMQSEKTKQRMPHVELVSKMTAFKKSLMIWGGSEVIKVWNSYELKSQKQMSPEDTMREFDIILRAIRKDLGHDDGALASGNLAALILVPEDKKVALGE